MLDVVETVVLHVQLGRQLLEEVILDEVLSPLHQLAHRKVRVLQVEVQAMWVVMSVCL